jgi:DNA-binding transcriptional LysR family regulator
VELRHLRYFLVVAEELSFTAAAARLRISQPPLSQQIQDLETELKTPLFLRTSRKVELTPAGIAFLDHVRSILGQVGQAVEQTQAIGSGKSGKLDIGATGSVLLGPLASIIAHYSRQHPEVLVRLHEMAPLAQFDSLHARKTDISFLRSPTEDPELVTEVAWREQVWVALPTGHRLSKRDRLRLADLRNDDHVFLRLEDSPFAQYLRNCCVEAGFIPRISQQVVEAYSLTSLVAGGLGVALVPESVRHLSRRGVIYRPLCEPAPAADVKMVFRPDGNPVVARFVELARELLPAAPSLETVVAQATKIRVNKTSGDNPPHSGKHEQRAVRERRPRSRARASKW